MLKLLAVFLTVALFVLKLIGAISIGWWTVFSPVLILIAYYVVLILAVLGAAIIVAVKSGNI